MTQPERGICPRCGSGEVIHIYYGFPTGDATEPSWVKNGGCLVPDDNHNRVCNHCGLEWSAVDTAID